MIKIMKGRKVTEAIMRRAASALIRPTYHRLCNPNKIAFCLIIHHHLKPYVSVNNF